MTGSQQPHSAQPLVTAHERPPLALCDESTAKHFITGGLLWLPAVAVDRAVATIKSLKDKRGIRVDTRIHCRVMFHRDARRRSPFSHLNPNDLHELLVECVNAMRGLGGSWFGAWIDRMRYPEQLQLVGGTPFEVGEKHLAGLAVFTSLLSMEHFLGTRYGLAFDPDKTKIDWGLVRLQQATHFARTHSSAITLPDEQRPLLEMADVAAYTAAQSLLASYEPKNWKAARFTGLLKLMEMRTGELAYTPWLRPHAA